MRYEVIRILLKWATHGCNILLVDLKTGWAYPSTRTSADRDILEQFDAVPIYDDTSTLTLDARAAVELALVLGQDNL